MFRGKNKNQDLSSDVFNTSVSKLFRFFLKQSVTSIQLCIIRHYKLGGYTLNTGSSTLLWRRVLRIPVIPRVILLGALTSGQIVCVSLPLEWFAWFLKWVTRSGGGSLKLKGKIQRWKLKSLKFHRRHLSTPSTIHFKSYCDGKRSWKKKNTPEAAQVYGSPDAELEKTASPGSALSNQAVFFSTACSTWTEAQKRLPNHGSSPHHPVRSMGIFVTVFSNEDVGGKKSWTRMIHQKLARYSCQWSSRVTPCICCTWISKAE